MAALPGRRWRARLGLAGLLLLFAALFCGSYLLAEANARRDALRAGERQLRIVGADLESVLQKYEALPYAMGLQRDVIEALQEPAQPDRIARLNAVFLAVARQSKAVSVYLMDRRGTTLASSNWNQPISFVGRNFAFRPYFQEAMRGRPGRFYGIGNATNEAGYFIAQPVYAAPGAAPIGVLTVKIDLSEFEQTWRNSEDLINLVDDSGVVFLSNQPRWKYHSLQLLAPQVQKNLAGTHQYADRPIALVPDLPEYLADGKGEHALRAVGYLDWQLMLWPARAHLRRSALLWAVGCSLLLAVAAVTAWALHQRRRRTEEQSGSRRALQLAAEQLEGKIAAATGELKVANATLEARYQALQQTETMLRSTQNELVQAGKLAMLGQMAAGVTHELNQPLAAIRAFADNAVTFLARERVAEARANLADISAACARMGSIIGQLKRFSRKGRERLGAVDLRHAVDASVRLLHNEYAQQGVAVEVAIALASGEEASVTGDSVHTEQVLVNLLHNALDASADVAEPARRRVTLALHCADGQAVLAIRDRGRGIAPAVAAHLFEPFFTTKPAGKGLGLGLAISSSIIQAMNGDLEARNHPDGGAEFIVRLPLLAGAGPVYDA